MDTITVVSEKGGVAKTTLAALLAMAAAQAGRTVTAADLDPRATLTTLLGANFKPGYSVDAILAADDPKGWAAQLQVPSTWHERLRVLPSERSLGNREKAPADHAEHRLADACRGLDADLLIVDTPPRPGGVLLLSGLALPAASVLYASTLDQDGLEGIAQGWRTVEAAKRFTNPDLTTLGIAISRADYRMVDARRCREELWSIYGADMLLMPMIPERVIVREARAACDWVGNYPAGVEIAELAGMLWTHIEQRLRRMRKDSHR
jgi:chromosome partitioning protein